jgi:hypothetical protein
MGIWPAGGIDRLDHRGVYRRRNFSWDHSPDYESVKDRLDDSGAFLSEPASFVDPKAYPVLNLVSGDLRKPPSVRFALPDDPRECVSSLQAKKHRPFYGADQSISHGFINSWLFALLTIPAQARPGNGFEAGLGDGTSANFTDSKCAPFNTSQCFFNCSQKTDIGLTDLDLELRFGVQIGLVNEIAVRAPCGR